MNSISSSGAATSAAPLELGELTPLAAGDASVLPQRLAAFAGVRTTVTVVAGSASATIGELLALKDGAVLPLDRAIDAPFDVILDGAVLARGQLVAIGDQFGLRITEVCMKGAE